MPRPLIPTPVDADLPAWLDSLGTRFAAFELQGSGCVSYGVATLAGQRFVKTFRARHDGSLHRALAVHAAVAHEAIAAPLAAYRLRSGEAALVYPWLDGGVLYPTDPRGAAVRTDPDGAMARFRALPTDRVEAALDAVLDAHVAVAAAGFVAVDFYDGCLLYDFAASRMHVVDVDEYRPGPFTLEADRLPGSTRFMAPEEFRRGAVIDERTTVFTLGRTLRLLLDAGDAESAWRGDDRQSAVITRATDPCPEHRHATVGELAVAWRAATAPR
ncbi:serine/threonine protein kinase [Catellatospora sichuanensis]|uniref:serine/threonine protein kinase n=1 Tax=Catellatospora sichuanensis TaxID=1969805 RepID=UPI001642CAB5|nr:serine/threonine protein kinase [Catellatospora sichuanensis]